MFPTLLMLSSSRGRLCLVLHDYVVEVLKILFYKQYKICISLGSNQDQGTVKDYPKRPGRILNNFARLPYYILLELLISITWWSRFHFPKRAERTLLLGILDILRSPFYSFFEESGQCLFEAF
jgi:hypothetical protein